MRLLFKILREGFLPLSLVRMISCLFGFNRLNFPDDTVIDFEEHIVVKELDSVQKILYNVLRIKVCLI